MEHPRWWQYGLLGGVAFSLATLVKVIGTIMRGAMERVAWTEAMGFALVIFGMGFMGGVVAWLGRGLSQRLGLVGDALVGMAVLLVTFTTCMLLFDPELLGSKWRSGGQIMLGLGALVGLIGGAWVGHDLRTHGALQKRHRSSSGSTTRDQSLRGEK